MNELEFIQKINAIADSGLAYGTGVFDKERYQELKDVASEFLKENTYLDKDEITRLLKPTIWYATPLSDVRAFILQNNQVLLIQSALDDKWALPGGYADVTESLKENCLKELKEEAGIEARVVKLLAIFDTNKWQPQARQFYKNVFLCEVKTMDFVANAEVKNFGWFNIDELPELSENRITEEQIRLLYKQAKTESSEVYVD